MRSYVGLDSVGGSENEMDGAERYLEGSDGRL